ncbi:unnamed protein product [Caenorhabditis bovis]|uniref:Ubiquitin carboxyl-terminal hydrolase 7 n=1 Tax=Caenorhabditis bovis TaxID=2654633 RepID=A0A8S1EB18_9PELO|nr:unnamed protein product [Caenorhabditis bovis]
MRSTPEPDDEYNDFMSTPLFNEQFDPYGPEGTLYLDIDYFSTFMEKNDSRLLSKPIIVRGIPWRILALCRPHTRNAPNHQRQRGHSLGFFLQCNNEDAFPKRGIWRCHGTATLEVINQSGGENISKKIHHAFHNNEVDWGFTNFEAYDTLMAQDGFVVNDTVRLKCHFSADVPSGNGYHWDSKKHTGFIGLRNQGATCYMNSILQAFYFTTAFRKAVYLMDTGTEPTESNICLAMQRVFYELQMSSEPVETNSLTRAFGWDKLDAFNQHDVQEFCRVLLDNLETKMKGTPQEQAIPELFRGNMKSFIKCTEVEYESSRTESFYDVQLNVLGMESLERAFEAYTATEVLDGDNKYDAGDHGLQRAEKGVKFVQLPPVLHVQLMRFQYCGVEQKVNERFTFPEEMSLEMCCELSDELKKEDCVYSLHAVLVHSGEFHGGHYVTFINTNLHEKNPNSNEPHVANWCKFDDDVVSKTTVDDAISSNFGGERSMNTSAYMLIYVRNTAIPTVLAPIPNDEIPSRVSMIFEQERIQRNQMRKKKEEESMCMELPVITPDVITGHHGFDLIDLHTLHTAAHESIMKNMSIYHLYRLIERRFFSSIDNSHDSAMDIEDGEDLGDLDDEEFISRESFRFRLWKISETYQNEKDLRTPTRFRPDTYLEPSLKDTVERMFAGETDAIYVELPLGPEECLQHYNYDNEVIVFVKYYDPNSRRLTVLGSTIVTHRRPIAQYSTQFCKMAGLPVGTQFRYYEEVSSMVINELEDPDRLAFAQSFTEEDGAIVIIEQIDLSSPENNVMSKVDDMYNTILVEFHEIVFNPRPDTVLHRPLLKKVRLDERLSSVTERIAKNLNVDQKNILILLKGHTARAEPCVDDYRNVYGRALIGKSIHDPRQNQKYRTSYAVMPFPITEMSKRVQMKILTMNEKMETGEMTIFPLKDGTVADMIEEAKRYFNFSENGTGKLRMVQVGVNPHYCRVHQICPESQTISEIEQKYIHKTRVEEIPADELEVGHGEFFLPVVHFDREPTRLFGTSFVIKVKNGELMKSVRDRVRRKLSDVSDAEFAKFKFALLAKEKLCRYIEFGENDKVNLQDMSIQTTGNMPQVYIGIDHKSPVSHSNENAIRILN